MGDVYALHAGDYVFRYVGMTSTTAANRFKVHKKRALEKRNTPVYDWMNKYGSMVQVVVLETGVDIQDLGWKESQWIATLRTFKEENSQGLNMTRGGQGSLGLKFSDERRKAHSEALLGRIMTSETNAKISASKQANPHKYTPEQLAKMRAAKLEVKQDPESVKRRIAKAKNTWASEEYRTKRSILSQEVNSRPEQKIRMKSKSRKCIECGLSSTAMGLGRHLKSSGHAGMVSIIDGAYVPHDVGDVTFHFEEPGSLRRTIK